ncbi:MAG: sensor histidine kinase [Chloroflexi bacterium AL-W]|nr:sensor histidine kinase [Chloroflexi bacterium AL-N1]NOK64572.1 sensor histidine kinase [Chloroflexi bacterium AL-N10]NOK75814.1 sensor histidine kinase [Chloroflexi bacterium AL-N5]NOK80427.1 sensor histidine kinase [Chloroflexi bacterium AL-W]NOK86941.1 sensor histidine kinase [Chloroflexi bacterium AL-N15]
MEKTLYFKTNTLLKNLVGKDLINDDNIAIVELVKNSYDARSEKVLVRVTNLSATGESTQDSQIIILDEGSGMDIKDIEDKWLNIAYSEKKLSEQENGAYLAGNKGIGRFSCDRLGGQLDLLTRKVNGNLLHLHINWSDFEIEGEKDLTIQGIPLNIRTIENAQAVTLAGIEQFPEQGTVLVISKLRSIWSRDRLKELKTSLEKFLNPNQLFLRDQFKIILSVPDLEKQDKGKNYPDRINGEIQNQIFNKLKFKTSYIEAKISSDNQTISTTLHHEEDKVFDLVERNDLYPLLAGTHVVIYYLNPYKKAYFKRQTGIRSVDFGSIFLFLNGFRIAPYGDRGDDWLGLDIRKTQGTSRYLSSRDVVGRIEINGSEEDFKPISSREGLKKTPAFNQLRENFFLSVLRKLERFVVEALQWDSVPESIRKELRQTDGLDWDNTSERYSESWERKKQRIALSIMTLIGSSPDRIISFWFNPALLEGVYESRQEEVKSLLEDIEVFEPDKIDISLTKSISRIRELIAEKEEEARSAKASASDLRVEIAKQDEKITQLEGEREAYRAQTLFLQQVTSLDIKQLMTYHHQINLDSEIVSNYITRAIKEIRNIPNTRAILDSLQKAALANDRMAAVAKYATKANFRSGTKKEPTDIPAFFEQYLLRVAKDFVATGLKLVVDNSVKELFEIKASRIELSILIDNIISNAKKAQAKNITVTITKMSLNTIRISFIDDGKGLSKEISNIDSIFEMGITTTSGSGLGLYHAKSIVEKIDGKILAFHAKPRGMEIRVEVTK